MLDDDVCYRAILSRDARFDGRFVTAVRTTRIYCRPTCPARAPLAKNVRFFRTAFHAERAGYRPCLRCRPDALPPEAPWRATGATVRRALQLIDEGALDHDGIDALARRLGIGARHLRRLFAVHLGASPQAVAQTRRAALARRLLESTALPVTEVAWAAGFRSVRRFNAAIRESYGRAPRELRTAAPGDAPTLEMRLDFEPPFDWTMLLDWLRVRAIPGVERVDGESYARDGVRITIDPERRMLRVRIASGDPRTLNDIVLRARRTFDLGAHPGEIAATLRRDPLLAPLLRRRPGIRVPGAWDPFELAVCAMAGTPTMAAGIAAAPGFSPDRLADAPLDGVPARLADAIRTLARAVASGRVVLQRGASLDDTITTLHALPGISARTANTIAMHALGEPDAFPAADRILRRKVGNLSERELAARAERWRPWRAYAAMLLWTS